MHYKLYQYAFTNRSVAKQLITYAVKHCFIVNVHCNQ